MSSAGLRDRVSRILPPVAVTLLLLAAWHFGVIWFNVPSYLLPAPLAVLEALKVGLIVDRPPVPLGDQGQVHVYRRPSSGQV